MKISINRLTLKLCLIITTLVFGFSGALYSQIPPQPNPPRLVNDLAGILEVQQVNELEQKLVAFADSTSNQIAVVIVPEFYGYDKMQLAYSIGEEWGVGQKDLNNGVVMLIKPKVDDSKGEVFIAVGYGLEAVVTDALSKRVIEREMIPHIKENDYYGGINAALQVLLPVISGEISINEYENSDGGSFWFFILLGVPFIILYIVNFFKSRSIFGALLLTFVDVISLIFSGGSSTYGGRSSGGSSGGFGGFGGGSFGGGGAGGSW